MRELLFAALPTGETVLGKLAKTTEDKPHHIPIEPLKYGNERMANEKVDKIREEMKIEGKGVGVVKSEGRFMVLVYDLFTSNELLAHKMGMNFVDDSLDAAVLVKRAYKETAPMSNLPKHGTARSHRRPLFATVRGERHNPRNRHNHDHKGQSDVAYHYEH